MDCGTAPVPQQWIRHASATTARKRRAGFPKGIVFHFTPHRSMVHLTPMNHRMTILAALAACLLFHPLQAADQSTEEERIERLVRQSPKLELPKLIAFNEAKLERIYQAKLKASDPEYRAALQKAQEAWRKYYEADLDVGALDTRGGSGEAVFAMQRHVYQLRLRIYQLSTDFLEGWVEIPKVIEPKGP